MRILSKLILSGLVVLAVAQAGHAGPLQRLFGGGRCRGGGCGLTVTQAAPVQYQPAAVTVVVQTSYSGAGVPVDSTPYQPIQMGTPLPTTCTNCQPQPAFPRPFGLFR